MRGGNCFREKGTPLDGGRDLGACLGGARALRHACEAMMLAVSAAAARHACVPLFRGRGKRPEEREAEDSQKQDGQELTQGLYWNLNHVVLQ